jgi:hypothetical protein
MSDANLIASITVTVHPPEHGRRANVPAQAGGCCTCCCCCCLHTVGGIVGAVIAPRMGQKPAAWSHLALIEEWDDEDYEPSLATSHPEGITEEAPDLLKKPVDSMRPDLRAAGIALSGTRPSAVRIFWWTLLILVVGGSGLFVVARGGDVLSIATIAVVMLFPCVQVAAVIVAAIILGVSDRPDRRYQLRQLGKIFLGAVGGAVAGVLVMFSLVLPFVGLAESGPWVLGILIFAGVFFTIYFSLVKAGLDRLWTIVAMVAGVTTLGGLYFAVVVWRH